MGVCDSSSIPPRIETRRIAPTPLLPEIGYTRRSVPLLFIIRLLEAVPTRGKYINALMLTVDFG